MSKCEVCPLKCKMKVGRCRVRSDGATTRFGRVSTAAIGPIEERLFRHFHPGMLVLAIGGTGCNMRCKFCQNCEVSQILNVKTMACSPRDAVKWASSHKAKGICFTYSEPIVWMEYVLAVAKEAKAAGLKVMMKTNGYAEKSVFIELCEAMDAVNIDVKGPREFYSEACGADAYEVVMSNLSVAVSRCHLEVSLLAIPGYYDAERAGVMFSEIRRAGDVPLHLLRLVPAHRMLDVTPMSNKEMESLAVIAKGFFKHVHIDY